MYFTDGSDRAFEKLMRTAPGFDQRNDSTSERDVCYSCDFYRPFWEDRYCVYRVCPFQSGRRTVKKKQRPRRKS